ncbi:MAG: DNA-binding response regulator, partial [Burkholderiales bacterium]
RQRWPQTPIIMLSSSTEPETVRLALARGALAFISKADSAARIVEVVGRALQGGLPAPGSSAVASGSPTHSRLGEAATTAALTPRQCEVLDLLAKGLSNKAIARHMQLSEFTVRGHVQAVLRILEVTSRSQAAIAARSKGLLGA